MTATHSGLSWIIAIAATRPGPVPMSKRASPGSRNEMPKAARRVEPREAMTDSKLYA